MLELLNGLLKKLVKLSGISVSNLNDIIKGNNTQC